MIKGVGIDIESVNRFRKYPFEKNKRFYTRIFTEKEIEYCLKKRDPFPHFTGKFAAKEAFLKALDNSERLYLKDIEIQNKQSGKPVIECKKKKSIEPSQIFLSISHTNQNATAIVIITE